MAVSFKTYRVEIRIWVVRPAHTDTVLYGGVRIGVQQDTCTELKYGGKGVPPSGNNGTIRSRNPVIMGLDILTVKSDSNNTLVFKNAALTIPEVPA